MIHYVEGYRHDSQFPEFRCDLKIQLESLMKIMNWAEEEECAYVYFLTTTQTIQIEDFEEITLPKELELYLCCEEADTPAIK